MKLNAIANSQNHESSYYKYFEGGYSIGNASILNSRRMASSFQKFVSNVLVAIFYLKFLQYYKVSRKQCQKLIGIGNRIKNNCKIVDKYEITKNI